MASISRDDVKKVLLSIGDSAENYRKAVLWARQHYLNQNIQFQDWEDQESSVICEILRALGDEAFYIIKAGHVPLCIDFLKSSSGTFPSAYRHWISNITFGERYGLNHSVWDQQSAFSYDMVLRIKKGVFLRHQHYGDIPIQTRFDQKNWQMACDLDYEPPLPPGAVRAHVQVQKVQSPGSSFSGRYLSFGIPRYFYQDIDSVCTDCKKSHVISIGEQKKWYETYQLPTYVQNNRCADCGAAHQAQKRLSEIKLKTDQDSENPELLLEEAKCRIRLFELRGEGNLETATSLIRKAARLGYSEVEARELEEKIQALRAK